MSDQTLHLAVSYEKGIDRGAVADFEADLATPGLTVKTEERPESGPFASLEWLVPTAVVVIIAKPYFESFLSEAGKDHYLILKKALVKLGQKFLGKDAPKTKLVHTPGKARSGTLRFSLVFSVYGEIAPSLSLKLLVESDTNPAELEVAIGAFVSALTSMHDGIYQTREKGISPIIEIGERVGIVLRHASRRTCCSRWCHLPCTQSS